MPRFIYGGFPVVRTKFNTEHQREVLLEVYSAARSISKDRLVQPNEFRHLLAVSSRMAAVSDEPPFIGPVRIEGVIDGMFRFALDQSLPDIDHVRPGLPAAPLTT